MSFNIARNKVVRLIEKAKKEAVINEMDNSKLNSRVLWKTLKSIFPTKAKQMSRINSLTKDGTIYSTPEVRSNVFNEHFISIADNIIDNTINTEPDLTSLVDFVNRKKAGNSADFSIPLISERDFFFNFLIFFFFNFLTKTSEQHKGRLLVVVSFFVYFRRVSSLTETSSGNEYN